MVKGQGEIPGAEKPAPESARIPGGQGIQVPNRAPTYISEQTKGYAPPTITRKVGTRRYATYAPIRDLWVGLGSGR
eukprot:6874867-Prymnesium_polylepis.1